MASGRSFLDLCLLALSLCSALASTVDGGASRRFWIEGDAFRKDGERFQIVGGDVHYFRIVPEYWKDRLLRAKALGLNTVQTYVPWNLHEPEPQSWEFNGFADIESYLRLAHELEMLVMLRVGPYICGEWDLGGFPPWLLTIEPALKLRSSDSAYLSLVERWWKVLLPKVAPLLYSNGGPIIMVQIENEFGSFGDDKNYLHYLVLLARRYLGNDIILYTTDGGTIGTLKNGSIHQDDVFAAVDFSTGDDPWPIFRLQKEYNFPGKSAPLTAEFYTGWLTHWGESIATTDASSTAKALKSILCRNGSAVLYMAHGGTNFGFYNGANTGQNESAYKADLTSYDYDAPIKEHGDVHNPKYKALRSVIHECTGTPLHPLPANIERSNYGLVKLQKVASLFDIFDKIGDPLKVSVSEQPLSMEQTGQMFGFLLYSSEYEGKGPYSILSIPKVHDRAQVFVSCSLDGVRNRRYAGIIERWSKKTLQIPSLSCSSKTSLYILVENMGRVNYGPYIFDLKGILSSVEIDGVTVRHWKMYPLSFDALGELSKFQPIQQITDARASKVPIHGYLQSKFRDSSFYQNVGISEGPEFYEGHFVIGSENAIKDTFISFRGWNKGVAFVNNFNIGRFWPAMGPQCALYVPAPILKSGDNVVVIFELHSPNPEHTINLVKDPDFTCGPNQ
ncbi:beta-galactosidase 8 isoform X1 [Brachypodium distachyon]|uniref:beta-galactosidase 8 isoform X1 n=1 Tax=Brachypodium distachyon TaxID=15368 RepID=UPI0001C71BD7|nr:beta-galactosidase 8 isoform X1 [Brachypodium distachyon]XP_014754600.1 beta-galactosidase 8 isoform X1 [Brachypodium distachyon]|eukprot:XP_003568002.1 beta-galactosidase 8 isoform X1 [Brachypodium distachyon]